MDCRSRRRGRGHRVSSTIELPRHGQPSPVSFSGYLHVRRAPRWSLVLMAKIPRDGVHRRAFANRAGDRGMVTNLERALRAHRSGGLARPASAVGWTKASRPTRPFQSGRHSGLAWSVSAMGHAPAARPRAREQPTTVHGFFISRNSLRVLKIHRK
jgi:hypothetical protein